MKEETLFLEAREKAHRQKSFTEYPLFKKDFARGWEERDNEEETVISPLRLAKVGGSGVGGWQTSRDD